MSGTVGLCCSSRFLLFVISLPATPLELGAQPVQPWLPDRSVGGGELRQLLEGLWPERVEPPAPVRPDGHEIRVLQDGELPRDTGLADVDGLDELADRALPAPQHLDDTTPGRIRQDLENIRHNDILL